MSSAADLPTHPAFSVAYTSTHLTNLTSEAAAISRKENLALRHAKTLQLKFQGDPSFAPNALASLAHDSFLDFGHDLTNGRAATGSSEHTRRGADDSITQGASTTADDMDIDDLAQSNGVPRLQEPNGTSAEAQNGSSHTTNGVARAASAEPARTNGEHAPSPSADDASDTASHNTAHRMTTRRRARAAESPSPPASPSSSVHEVHPMFVFPASALPDRDLGLPADEAEDTRLLLMAYVQKQEEVARLAAELFAGIMQGERMRQEVLKMAKAEAHLGEMSDGEDWYDRAEWNLTEDLGKGKDEEEEDAVVTGKKSTRQRRKPDKEDR